MRVLPLPRPAHCELAVRSRPPLNTGPRHPDRSRSAANSQAGRTPGRRQCHVTSTDESTHFGFALPRGDAAVLISRRGQRGPSATSPRATRAVRKPRRLQRFGSIGGRLAAGLRHHAAAALLLNARPSTQSVKEVSASVTAVAAVLVALRALLRRQPQVLGLADDPLGHLRHRREGVGRVDASPPLAGDRAGGPFVVLAIVTLFGALPKPRSDSQCLASIRSSMVG